MSEAKTVGTVGKLPRRRRPVRHTADEKRMITRALLRSDPVFRAAAFPENFRCDDYEALLIGQAERHAERLRARKPARRGELAENVRDATKGRETA